MSLSILYEDNDILAVNKPSGLIVHADGKREERTLVEEVEKQYPHMRGVGEPLTLSSGEIIQRSGVVHRIDKETSGIILFAKNQESFLFLKKKFQDRNIEKTYKAFTYGVVEEDSLLIDKPIGRSTSDFRKRTSGVAIRGNIREAQTEYTVRARSDAYTYLDVSPKTGRTHQIRVHLDFIGNPIVCDSLYAPKRECPSSLGRLGLHASSLSFKNNEGTSLLLEAPTPSDFRAFIKEMFPELHEEV